MLRRSVIPMVWILFSATLLFVAPLAGAEGVREEGNGNLVVDASASDGGDDDGRKLTPAELEAARARYRAYMAKLKREYEERVSIFPECRPDLGTPEEWCAWSPPESTGGRSPAPPREVVERYVRTVTASLQLPQAYPQVGPDPTWNEWNMAVIGIPLWLWVEGQDRLTASMSEAGLTVSLDARHVRTTFEMGDGRTVTCTTTKPYVRNAVEPATPSPVCGHTYQVAPRSPSPLSAINKEPGTYRVTATTHWSVDWTAGGYSGTLTTEMSGSRDLSVGELQAVVIRD